MAGPGDIVRAGGDGVDSPGAGSALAGERVPASGLTGPALWIAIGVVLGASVCGSLMAYFRQAPLGVVSQRAAAGDEGVGAAGARPVTGVARRINLNTATQAELELLPDIGPTVAKRIIDYRAQRGGFSSTGELDRIKGIGPRTLERLRPLVTVEAAPATGR